MLVNTEEAADGGVSCEDGSEFVWLASLLTVYHLQLETMSSCPKSLNSC